MGLFQERLHGFSCVASSTRMEHVLFRVNLGAQKSTELQLRTVVRCVPQFKRAPPTAGWWAPPLPKKINFRRTDTIFRTKTKLKGQKRCLFTFSLRSSQNVLQYGTWERFVRALAHWCFAPRTEVEGTRIQCTQNLEKK